MNNLPLKIAFYFLSLCPTFCIADNPLFTPASPNYIIRFPFDHGSHPGYETEWWYYTGHLVNRGENIFKSNSLFGFQLTFFRRNIDIGNLSPTTGQTFLAHGALSDLKKNKYLYDHKIASGSLGIGGAKTGRLNVWNGDWNAQMIGDSHVLRYKILDDEKKTIEINLISDITSQSKSILKPVLNGENGYSRKAKSPNSASHYYSYPKLMISGEVIIGDTTTNVSGIAWMDHEFMSNALNKDQVGWDWFSLNLADGRSIMLFHLRNSDGNVDFKNGTITYKDGTNNILDEKEFQITPISTFKSKKTGVTYPSKWEISVPSEQISLTLAPLIEDQEFVNKDLSYWEGAIASQDNTAKGYAELTGYANSLKDKL